jgi:hypothetical protein
MGRTENTAPLLLCAYCHENVVWLRSRYLATAVYSCFFHGLCLATGLHATIWNYKLAEQGVMAERQWKDYFVISIGIKLHIRAVNEYSLYNLQSIEAD